MKDISWTVILLLLILGFGAGIFLSGIMCPGDYKDGQIDALTGNIKYELITQEDSTRVWKLKEGE